MARRRRDKVLTTVTILIPCTSMLIVGMMWCLDLIHGRSAVAPWQYAVIALAYPAIVLAIMVPVLRRNLRRAGILRLQLAVQVLDAGDMPEARRHADWAARRLVDSDLAQSLRRKANLPDDEFAAALRTVHDGVAGEVP